MCWGARLGVQTPLSEDDDPGQEVTPPPPGAGHMSPGAVNTTHHMSDNHGTSPQVQVLLAVISCQPGGVVRASLEDWARFCDSDGLYETRKSFEDISSSFEDGEPKEKREFFDENNCVRKEWIQWIYNKL